MPAREALPLDTRVRCGLTLAGLSRKAALEQARRGEALGFDSLWVTDHLAFHIPIADPLALLSFAAAATERVTLGTSILLLALRHPALVAKEVATLDVLSGGRVVLGVGLGGEYPPEFRAVGVPVRERAARVDESIPLLRRLWREDGVVHAGRHFDLGPLSIEPRPVRRGGPPIWIGGRSEAAMARAGRLGDGYLSHMATPTHYAANLDRIARAAAAAGREPRGFDTAAYLFTWIDATVEAAEERAAPELGRIYARPFPPATIRKYCLAGPPEACLERLRAFVEAGTRHFVLAPLVDAEAAAAAVAETVLPELQTLLP